MKKLAQMSLRPRGVLRKGTKFGQQLVLEKNLERKSILITQKLADRTKSFFK
jgi:hypothetical protein